MRRNAFTLIELLVSLAMVLILIVGVNQVFRIATTSIGAGQALSDSSRDNRAIQAVLYNDFQQSIIRSSDSPCFVIRSARASAFRDRKEMLSSQSYAKLYAGTPDPTAGTVDTAIRSIDLNGNNVEGEGAVAGEVVPRNDLSQRNYRQDMMCFFARGLYPRQTANDGQYSADMSSGEAWIWYGQLRQPIDFTNTSSSSKDPGTNSLTGSNPKTENETSNPNNFYARQWGLGRVAMLLKDPSPPLPATNGTIADKAGNPQFYVRRLAGAAATSTAPLAAGTGAFNGSTTDGINLEQSRYDLAGTSVDSFRTILKSVIPLKSTNPTWYGPSNLTPRFAGYPYPTKPLSSYGVARTTPWLVGGCTQFIVEFAGDYLSQDPTTGAVTGNYSTAATDGQIDFVVNTDATRNIRWYGFPRDVTGPSPGHPDGAITAVAGDVVPLRDLLGFTAPIEHFSTASPTLPAANYMNPAQGAEYIVAWQPAGSYGLDASNNPIPEPPRPKMLRITMKIDDPNGRLPDGQTYEYVIALP